MRLRRIMHTEQRKNRMFFFFLESVGSENKKVLLEMRREQGKKLRVAYTVVDGLTSVRCELEEYLKSKKPDSGN